MVRADVLQALVDHCKGEVWPIAFAAQMAEVKMSELGRHDFLRRIRRI